MCVLLFSLGQNERYPFVLAANRDEFYDRRAQAADFWPDHPDVLAGRDESSSGTWLGISRNGRFAAITNHPDPSDFDAARLSRGNLTRNFLTGDCGSKEYLCSIESRRNQYNGYGLVFGTMSALHYHSNRGGVGEILSQGAYGLGNDLLRRPWPKVELGTRRLGDLMTRNDTVRQDELFEIISDESAPKPIDSNTRPDDRNLPLFVRLGDYGTRCSTVIMIDRRGKVSFEERTYEYNSCQTVDIRSYQFDINN